MGSATREQRLAAIAAVLGVSTAMCNRDQEPSAFPVQAKEVPSAVPDPSGTAPIDAGTMVAENPDASPAVASVADAAPAPSARPLPPPPLATPLAAFDRFTPPAARPPGPPPPTPPPEHCCSTNPSCGVRDCGPSSGGNGINGPRLFYTVSIGLKPKQGLDAETSARAVQWIRGALWVAENCASGVGAANDDRGGTMTIEAHAGSGATRVDFVATSATLSKALRECVAKRFATIAGGLVIDGPPPKLVFPIVFQATWSSGANGLGGLR